MRFPLVLFVALAATLQTTCAFIASPNQVISTKKTSTFTTTTLDASATGFTPEELERKFSTLKKSFPADASPVKAGGWHNLKQLSGNPKEELVNMIVDGLKKETSKVEFEANEEKLEALLTLLYGMGKGFEADAANGDWLLVFTKQGKKSPRVQKLVGKGEKAGLSISSFDIKAMKFSGDTTVLKKCKVDSTVKYSPLSTAYSKTSDGKIVLRRIGCDIVRAGVKVGRLPRLPLPFLRKKGGYLDFIYMDKDIRITKGNLGGVSVHFRPEFLEAQLAK